MNQPVIEPLPEAKRWRTRDVKYWGGTWDAVSSLIPKFEIGEFKADKDSPPNPYMKTVIRVPQKRVERPIPVGVVSNSYGLVQHHEVAEKCFEGLINLGFEPRRLRCEVGLTELGEWMHLRIFLPQEKDFKRSELDRLRLKFECFNSVDGSCRLLILIGWTRLICTNGMVIGDTKTVNDIHNSSIDLGRVPDIITGCFGGIATELVKLQRWLDTPVSRQPIASWANKALSDAWGIKAACRVLHICQNGHDVEVLDYSPGTAAEKLVRQSVKVPGSPAPAANLFDVSQALSWVATGRNNPDERVEWQTGIPRLVERLEEMVGSS